MKSGIYKLEWGSGHFYYGRAANLRERKTAHISAMKKGTHFNERIQLAFLKYGVPEFKIVEHCEIVKLSHREDFYIDQFFGMPFCCNLISSGKGLSKESRSKLSRSKGHVLLNTRTGFYFIGTESAAKSIGMKWATLRKKLSKGRKNNTPFIYFNNSSKAARDKIKALTPHA